MSRSNSSADNLKLVFSYTEVLPIESETSGKLPKLNYPKTAGATKQKHNSVKEIRKDSDWQDFLARNQTTKNKTTTELLEKAFKEESEYKTSTQFRKNLSPQILELEKQVLNKKRTFNQLRHKVLHRKNYLYKLNNQIQKLECVSEVNQNKKLELDNRQGELQRVQNQLEKELVYRDTLNYMYKIRKKSLNFADKPINSLKEKLRKLTTETNKNQNYLSKIKAETNNCLKEAQKIKLEQEKLKKAEKAKLESFENKQKDIEKMAQILKEEQEINQQAVIAHSKKNLVLKMEPLANKLEEEEAQIKELEKAHTECMVEKQKFEEIRNVTSISSVQEAKAYYEQLTEKETELQNSIKEATSKLEELTKERQQLNQELNQLLIHNEADRESSSKELQNSELKLKERTKTVENNEQNLNKLMELLSSACGVVSRLSSTLFGKKDLDVKPRNVDYHLRKCAEELYLRYGTISHSRFT